MSESRLTAVGIDGYNLALPEGTGVATYGRTLVHVARGLGYRIDGVYGLAIPRVKSPALRDILFFGALGEEPQAPARGWKSLVRQGLIAPWPRMAQQVPMTGDVISAGLTHRVPPFDRLFNFGNLFTVGMRYFRRYGRFLPLRVPQPPPVMHWTYPVPVRLLGARNLYTIHDLVPLRLPYASTEDKRYHRRLLRQCLRTGHIVTVSEHSRADILKLLPGAAPENVTNTYQAVVPEAPVQALAREALAHRLETLFGLTAGGYFLFLGALEPKKNVGRLIEAYISAGVDAPLVTVGPNGWRADGELRLLSGADGQGLSAGRRIRRISYLPRELLMLLVRGARAVLMPSLYEGFGLPVLEAMSLGVPVLTANGSSLAEIGADAVLKVDPYAVNDIRQGILRLDADDALRARLAAAGPARAAHFSIEAYARRVEALYQGLFRSGDPAHARQFIPQSETP